MDDLKAIRFVLKVTIATLIGITTLAYAASADASTYFLKGKYRDGSDTHCVYEWAGHHQDVNVGFTGICDFTIEVDD